MDSYLQLLLSGIQTVGKKAGKCTVIALTASLPGEGVSFVTESFAAEIAGRTGRRVIIADIETLQNVDIFHYSRIARFCLKTDVRNLYVLHPGKEDAADAEKGNYLQPLALGESELERGLSNLQSLRYSFDFVLLDCPSLKESDVATLFARAADGMIVVVEAERTRKQQIHGTINSIEMAQGNLLGCVLNKRQYPIPEWVYRRL